MENQKKIRKFIKQYLALIIIIACILAIAATTLGVYFYNKYSVSDLPDDGNNSKNDDKEPVDDPNDKEPVDDPNDKEPVDAVISWGLPVSGFTIGMDYSATSPVFCSTNREYLIHKAIDFLVSDGADVVSVMDGEVESVEHTIMDGTVITVRHADGVRSIYASLSDDTAVTAGQNVRKGDLLGYASDSAYSELAEGAHLHFEMTLNGVVVNPHDYLTIEA